MKGHDICQNCGWRRGQHKPETSQCPDRTGGWGKTTFIKKFGRGTRKKKPQE